MGLPEFKTSMQMSIFTDSYVNWLICDFTEELKEDPFGIFLSDNLQQRTLSSYEKCVKGWQVYI